MESTLASRRAPSTATLELRYPPLPKTLLQALELMRVPGGPTVEQTLEMVEQDPAVAARLLKVVNSALYSRRVQITSIQRAIVSMGPVRVTSLVMSMNLRDVQASLNGQSAALYLDLVRHSVAVAFIARTLIEEDDDSPQGPGFRWTSYTTGLMHDLGKMVLLYSAPEVAAEFYQPRTEPLDTEVVLAMEREQFGCTHLEANEPLMTHMGLEATMGCAVRYHHEEPPFDIDDPKVRHLATVVAAADLAANAFGYQFDHPVSKKVCAEHPLWDILIDDGVVGYASPQAMLEMLAARRDDLDLYVNSIL